MTVTSHEATDGIQNIIVHDDAGPLSFRGEVVADLSWTYDAAFERGHHRWTDIALYRVHESDSPYEYVIQIVGRSVLYHRSGGPCPQGTGTTVRRLRQDEARYAALLSCNETGCQPEDLEDLKDSDMVSVEGDWFTLIKCRDAADTVHAIQNREGREQMGKLSAKLLQVASWSDEGIKQAMIKTRRL